MKPITLMLKPNTELMFEAYCRAKGMPPQEVLNGLVNRLISENEEFIYDWLRKADVGPGNIEKSSDQVPVHNVFKGEKHEAIFSTSRGQVNLSGDWMTPSAGAMRITTYPVNGWTFWKYVDEMGQEQPIDQFRKQPPRRLALADTVKRNKMKNRHK